MKVKIKKVRPGWIFCGIFALLGVLIDTILVGHGFLALVCWGIAGILASYSLLRLLSKKFLKTAKVLRLILSTTLCIGILIAAVTGTIVAHASFGAKEVPCDYVVVLGCKVNNTVPSLSLRDRINGAYDFLAANPDVICIVSGGQGDGEDISEAECMFRELTGMGIEAERIWLENKSTSTRENLKFSLEVIRERTGEIPTQIGIISSEYHLYRAGMFAKELELTPYGILAKTSWASLWLNYFLREIAAVVYYTVFG